MWSYIQHQRIKKQVAEEYEKKKHGIGDHFFWPWLLDTRARKSTFAVIDLLNRGSGEHG